MAIHQMDQRRSENLPVARLVLRTSDQVPSSAQESHVAPARDELLLLWRSKSQKWKRAENYSFDTMDQYMAFRAAIEWLHQTVEALSFYLSYDLSTESLDVHLEVGSLLQAVCLQQNAIGELEYSLLGHRTPLSERPSSWTELRTTKNSFISDQSRKVLNGLTIGYFLEATRAKRSIREHHNPGPTIDFSQLFWEYDREAGMMIKSCTTTLSQRLA